MRAFADLVSIHFCVIARFRACQRCTMRCERRHATGAVANACAGTKRKKAKKHDSTFVYDGSLDSDELLSFSGMG